MLDGYRFRLYPTPEQPQTLLRWIGCQRLIDNAKVQEDRYFRRFAQRMVGTAGQPVPVDQPYRQFITERTPFLRDVPSQILRNGAAKFRQAYQRFFKKLGGRPKIKKKSGRQAVWLTKELLVFIPQFDQTGAIASYQLSLGTKKFPVGIIPYMAHRPHAAPSSLHIAVEGGHWWLSFAAEDAEVTMPKHTADATTAHIAEDLRHLSAEQLTERTLGGDRGVAKPLTTSEGQVFDLLPVQKKRIKKTRRQRQRWQRKASRRKKGSQNQKKAYRKAARYQPYEVKVRQEYAHQTSHALVVHAEYDLYVFEALQIKNMTKRPKAKKDAQGRFLPNGAKAKAGLNRAILSSAWGQVVAFTIYKALRHGKLVITVPPAYSSQECAVCTFTSPDNRPTQAEFSPGFAVQLICQRCGHPDNADRNAAVVIAKRGINQLLSGDPLTTSHQTTRIFRTLGPERSKVTPGELYSEYWWETDIRHAKPTARTQKSRNPETSRSDPGNPHLNPSGELYSEYWWLGGGRVHYTRWGFRDLIETGGVTILQPDLSWVGGITETRRICALASAYHLAVVPHAGGLTAAGLHLIKSQVNAPYAEWVRTWDRNQERPVAVIQGVPDPIQGKINPSDEPGLGIQYATQAPR